MNLATSIPRIVVAATGSGAGKTTITVGVIAALRARGLNVAPFKCGPDYLDPSYHARAAGRPSHNLDGWMMGRDAVLATFADAARDSDIAVIEGMMGLYDAATPTSDEGSTAEIARWLDAPVLLAVDASGMARSIAAVVLGFAHFDPRVRVAGVIGNRLGSRGHLDILRAAMNEIPVLGGLPQNDDAAFPERHLGLFSADDNTVPSARFATWARLAAEWFDLDAILALARSAPALAIERAPRADVALAAPRCRIGVAYDTAFQFYYHYNLSRLEALGAQIVRFSPIRDRSLPPVDGLYFGGGYPEAAAQDLSANRTMLTAVHDFAARGGPIYAECGGLMYLADAIRTLEGVRHPMVGLIPATAEMHDRLQALGYVDVETRAPSLFGSVGTRFRGHQFRYSTLSPSPASLECVYSVAPRWGGAPFTEGYRRSNLLASYIHAHWGSNDAPAVAFVDACARFRLAR